MTKIQGAEIILIQSRSLGSLKLDPEYIFLYFSSLPFSPLLFMPLLITFYTLVQGNLTHSHDLNLYAGEFPDVCLQPLTSLLSSKAIYPTAYWTPLFAVICLKVHLRHFHLNPFLLQYGCPHWVTPTSIQMSKPLIWE